MGKWGGKQPGAGRKPLVEEAKIFLVNKYLQEEAQKIVKKKLNKINLKEDPETQEVKDIAMPLVLKSMADKQELTGKDGEKLIPENNTSDEIKAIVDKFETTLRESIKAKN